MSKRASRTLTLPEPIPDRPWIDQAMCRGMDPNRFHPCWPSNYRGQSVILGQRRAAATALAICERCPVKEECLACHLYEPDGVYGGTVPKERSLLIRGEKLEQIIGRTCADCGGSIDPNGRMLRCGPCQAREARAQRDRYRLKQMDVAS